MSKSEEELIAYNLENYKWMIRPCLVYDDENSECTSIRGRFHQYFIFGDMVNCAQWKTDYKNCKLWETTGDSKAASDVIESEKMRKRERLKAHDDNDVWTNRSHPPEDWNAPLPEHIFKRQANSLLTLYNKSEIPEVESKLLTSCTIM